MRPPTIATATTGAEQRLHELQAAALAAGTATDVSRYAQEAVEQLARLIGSTRCAIMVVRDGVLRLAGSVGLPADLVRAADGLSIGPHVGTSGAAAARGTTVVTPDLLNDRKWETLRDLAVAYDIRSCVSVPLMRRDGTVIGTFASYGTEPVAPDRATLELAEAHASLVALGLERFQQEARVAEGYGAVVAALSSALDVRDEYTGSHSAETATLALDVGRRMGLDSEAMRTLEHTALLHDVGKLGIPTEILHAPRPLTPSERELMEEHPVIGERILSGIPYLQEVATAVRHEHERWDGRGYPDGLVGEAIPLASRLVFVCDAWHAMTSDRPYRKSLGENAARDELREHAGGQFDPDAVRAVLDLVEARPASGASPPEHSRPLPAPAPDADESPARDLAAEHEVLEAVRAVTTVQAPGLEKTLSRVAAVAARTLSCSYAAVVLRDASGDTRAGAAPRGWRPPAGRPPADMMAPLVRDGATLPIHYAIRGGADGPVPGWLAASGVTAALAVPAGEGAALVAVHASEGPGARDFGERERRMARSLGHAAEPVVGRALAAERLAETQRFDG